MPVARTILIMMKVIELLENDDKYPDTRDIELARMILNLRPYLSPKYPPIIDPNIYPMNIV